MTMPSGDYGSRIALSGTARLHETEAVIGRDGLRNPRSGRSAGLESQTGDQRKLGRESSLAQGTRRAGAGVCPQGPSHGRPATLPKRTVPPTRVSRTPAPCVVPSQSTDPGNAHRETWIRTTASGTQSLWIPAWDYHVDTKQARYAPPRSGNDLRLWVGH